MPLCPRPGSPHSCAGGHLGWRSQVGLHLHACLLSLWVLGLCSAPPALLLALHAHRVVRVLQQCAVCMLAVQAPAWCLPVHPHRCDEQCLHSQHCHCVPDAKASAGPAKPCKLSLRGHRPGCDSGCPSPLHCRRDVHTCNKPCLTHASGCSCWSQTLSGPCR